jgi:hypothetical protein
MIVPDDLPHVLSVLETLRISYAVTGSLASVLWGRPRATYVADILIDLRLPQATLLKRELAEPAWYLDIDSARQAIRHGTEFNAIHGASATKVDFWPRRARPFDANCFARRKRESMAGIACWVLSPEDTVLSKLEWIRQAPSDRQLADVLGVLEVQAEKLDEDYLRKWATVLGVSDLLESAFRRLRP